MADFVVVTGPDGRQGLLATRLIIGVRPADDDETEPPAGGCWVMTEGRQWPVKESVAEMAALLGAAGSQGERQQKWAEQPEQSSQGKIEAFFVALAEGRVALAKGRNRSDDLWQIVILPVDKPSGDKAVDSGGK